MTGFTTSVFIYNALLLCCVVNNMEYVHAECHSMTVPLSNFAQNGKTLYGYTYRQVSRVQNVQICAKHCLLHRKCRSINYNSDLELCDLNSEDHLTSPQSLLPSITSQYYIINGWPELLLGGCEHHTCPETHVCEDEYIGLYPSYKCVVYDLPTVPSTTALSPMIGCTNVLPTVSEVIVNSTTVRFSPVACVHSPGTTLQTLLHNYRGGIDWSNLQPIIDGCASLAYTNSYRYFGVEFYGECWADRDFVEASHNKIPANDCGSQMYNGVGAAHVICVYEVL